MPEPAKQGTAETATTATAGAPATTAAPVAAQTATENKEDAATHVKPVGEISEATSVPSTESTLELEDEGWGSFSSLVFLLAVIGLGVAFWRLGGIRYAKLLISGKERAQYRRVNADVEV